MPTAAHTLPLLTPVSSDDLGQLQLNLPSLKVVSYRGPGESGGVSTSLGPVVKRLGTKINWFAVSGMPTVSSAQFDFHTPEIPHALLDKHHRISAGYLWPLLHGMPEKTSFDPENWKAFRQVNEIVASECLDVSSQSFPTLYWLHDYEIALVAPLVAVHAGIILTHFWHVPWPSPDVISASPIARELVDALLCNKVLGFHTAEYATNFLNTVQELFPNAIVDTLRMEVRRRRAQTRVVVMPLGIDFDLWQRLAKSARPLAEALSVKHGLANQIVLGVDRLDYSKGVLEKLNGLEEFLTQNPQWLRRINYVQIGQKPQSVHEEYAVYARAVSEKIAQINEKFGTPEWQPILYIEKHLDQEELAGWYQAADVLAVNPVRDGLNLIAKEFVACRLDEQGVLLLSQKAGCAAELTQGAIAIDPNSPGEFAKGLALALNMEAEEKRRRMSAMRRVVGWNRLHDWALGFLREAISNKSATTSAV
jgi:trehalose 6-phosphate synthase/phosphatase